jgi:hypothetical protein
MKKTKANYMSFRLDDDFRLQIKICAALEGMSIQAVLEEAVEEWIEKREASLQKKLKTKTGIGRIQAALKDHRGELENSK